MKAVTIASIVLSLMFATVARAGVCNDYRAVVDTYVAVSAGVVALSDTLKAARRALGAARATRAALKGLNTEPALNFLQSAGATRAGSQLTVANAASTAAIDASENIFKIVKSINDDLASARAGDLDAARSAADTAADLALDSVGAFKAATLRGTLKAASASVSASHGKATSSALVSVYESIYRAACR